MGHAGSIPAPGTPNTTDRPSGRADPRLAPGSTSTYRLGLTITALIRYDRPAMPKKKTPKTTSSKSSGGSLMGLRSGFQKMTGAKKSRTKRSPWTFPQVLMAVGGAALLIALVYAMSR